MTTKTATTTKRTKKASNGTPPPPVKTILGLRTCNADLTSYDGFQWPESGRVQCPDWNPKPVCGGGLHFLPWGEGDGGLLNWNADAKWLVVEVEADSVVDIDGDKSKAPWCNVIYCGDRLGATEYIANNGGQGRGIHGSTLTGGYKSTLTGGYKSTLTGGDYSTLTGGDYSTLTGGYKSTLTGGYKSTLTGGNESILMIKRWNGKRYKFSVGYIGEDGLLPDTAYRLDDEGNFVAAN